MKKDETFIDLYKEYASEFTDAPEIVHERIALSMLSMAVNRNVWLQQGHKNVYANLWMIVVAPSSFYRKSYSLSIGEDILRASGLNLILPREFSHEALLSAMAARPKGLLIFYEFKTFMDMLGKEYMAGTKSILTELYDNPYVYDRKILSNPQPIVISEPFLNIISATTIDWMVNSLKDGDLAGGFLPRFLVVVMPKKTKPSIPFQKKSDPYKRTHLIQMLVNKNKLSGEMEFDKEALNAYEEWYFKFEEESTEKSDLLMPFLVRMTEYVKKFSMLFAINRADSFTVNIEDVEQATNLAGIFSREMERMVKEEFVFDRTGKSIKKIENIVKNHIGSGIIKSKILKKSHMNSRELDSILQTLVESETIEREAFVEVDNLGREKQFFRYTYCRNGDEN